MSEQEMEEMLAECRAEVYRDAAKHVDWVRRQTNSDSGILIVLANDFLRMADTT